MNKRTAGLALLGSVLLLETPGAGDPSTPLPYRIVDTGQIRTYDNHTEIAYPAPGTGFFGQDAQYNGNQPAYRDNGDGTVTDLNTGLMWQADPGPKKTFAEARQNPERPVRRSR